MAPEQDDHATRDPVTERYIAERLAPLRDILARASIGDFSKDVAIPTDDNAFAELYVGIQIMLEVIREKIAELERFNRELGKRARQLERSNRDLHASRERLANEKARHEAILAALGEGLVVVDRAGAVVLVNKAFEQALGWRAREIVGRKLTAVVPREDEQGRRTPDEQRVLVRVLHGEKISTGPTEPQYFVRRDGTRFPVALVATPIRLKGNLIGVVEAFRDITEERAVDRAKTEFVSLASHQLRTPLTVIRWSMDELDTLRSYAGSKERKYFDAIKRAARDMTDLIDALLNVSRIELGKLVVESATTHLEEILGSALRSLAPMIRKGKLRLETRIDPKLPAVNLDPKLTRVALHNLLTNAIKYTPAGGSLTVAITRSPDALLVTVADTGMGIPRSAQQRIFSKLFRADNAKQLHPHGTGLGLYVTKAVVEQSGGTIWFTSKEGKGTTFSFTLPLHGVTPHPGTTSVSEG